MAKLMTFLDTVSSFLSMINTVESSLFGGRTMGNDPAKYKNSRETPLFDKSLVLYGFQTARTEMRQKKSRCS